MVYYGFLLTFPILCRIPGNPTTNKKTTLNPQRIACYRSDLSIRDSISKPKTQTRLGLNLISTFPTLVRHVPIEFPARNFPLVCLCERMFSPHLQSGLPHKSRTFIHGGSSEERRRRRRFRYRLANLG